MSMRTRTFQSLVRYLACCALSAASVLAVVSTADAQWPVGLPQPGHSYGQVSKGEPSFSQGLKTFPATPAEEGGVRPDAFEEKGGGGQWTCNNTWDIVTNKASGVLIGNCSKGRILNRTKYSTENASGIKFSGGYINGSYNYCGWLETGKITFKDGENYTGCSEPSTPYGKIGYAYNSRSQPGPTPTTTVNPGCQLYANVHPWKTTPEVTDLLTPSALPVGSPLQWRYIVGYGPNQPHRDGRYGDYWVAIYDPAGYGGASWAYAPFYGCFANSKGEVFLPPGEGGYWFPEE
jgi:hypothetical protein